MRTLSLFSGIGAFEKAIVECGLSFELVGYSEIDKYASKSYSAVHGIPETMNLGDITKIDEQSLPKDIDLVTYGFPCQDISLAGKQKGLFNEDGTQTRSGLFFDALRIIEATQPRVAIAENVKNLVGKKFKEQFEIVLDSLENAGYNNYWKVLNAKDYGIPQNRERVFIVSIRKDIDNGMFTFPEGIPLELRLKDMLEDVVDEKYYIKSDTAKKLVSMIEEKYEITDREVVDGTINDLGVKEVANCIKARYDCGVTNYKSDGVMVVEPVLIGGMQKNQAVKTDGVCTTLTSSMGCGGGYVPMVTDRPIQAGNLSGGKWDKMHDVSRRYYDPQGIAPTIHTCQGGNTEPKVVVSEPTIQRVDIPQTVTVRKYPVDTEKLRCVLREAKKNALETNYGIAEVLGVPMTKVEHWFRQDDCFSIPDASVWLQLKELLEIETDEFDESIMTFEEKEGVYEKSERHYHVGGIAPTLTSTSAGNEKFIVEGATNE